MSSATLPGPRPVLVTGAAGFIGAHVAARLALLGNAVFGCDNFNTYYDPQLKHGRVRALLAPLGVECADVDIADAAALSALFDRVQPRLVVHLAAQAGVRYSIEQPAAYVQSNLVGFANILEASQLHRVDHLVYASSSSVYGAHAHTPFAETDSTDAPVSFYAATKKANEAMAHAYAHIHRLRCTGLRFFTVYGPWGRPDMAYFSFARRLVAGQPLPIFAEGRLLRDFTYIDDVVEGVVRLVTSAPRAGEALHGVYNIGNHQPVTVLDFVQTLASVLGVNPTLEFLPMQPGDVPVTCADCTKLRERVGFEPSTPLRLGLERFAAWFQAHRQDL